MESFFSLDVYTPSYQRIYFLIENKRTKNLNIDECLVKISFKAVSKLKTDFNQIRFRRFPAFEQCNHRCTVRRNFMRYEKLLTLKYPFLYLNK